MVPNLTLYIKKLTNGVPTNLYAILLPTFVTLTSTASGVKEKKNIFTTGASFEELLLTVFYIMEVRGSNL